MTGTITVFTTPEGYSFGLGTVDIDGGVDGIPTVPCPRCEDGKEAETKDCLRCDGAGRVLAVRHGVTAPVFLNELGKAGSIARLLNS